MHSEIEKAVEVLAAGGLVAIPTETVYGLAADAENAKAVRAIYEAKQRPANHPLIVHLASADAIEHWASEIPEEAKKLTKAFWPGPLTLVLKRSANAKDFITGGQNTVALRCPSHPLTRELLQLFDGGTHRGVAAPSANTFGKISPTTAQHVREDLGEKPEGKVDFILDGGTCSVGIESTILDLTSGEPRILREGEISGEMISKVLGKPVLHGPIGASPRVSGSLKSHYAPEHPLKIVSVEDLAGEAQFLARHFQTFSLIAPASLAKRFAPISTQTRSYENPKELQINLYRWLHELDNGKSDVILAVAPELSDSTAGVLDRLTRAAAEKPAKESK